MRYSARYVQSPASSGTASLGEDLVILPCCGASLPPLLGGGWSSRWCCITRTGRSFLQVPEILSWGRSPAGLRRHTCDIACAWARVLSEYRLGSDLRMVPRSDRIPEPAFGGGHDICSSHMGWCPTPAAGGQEQWLGCLPPVFWLGSRRLLPLGVKAWSC